MLTLYVNDQISQSKYKQVKDLVKRELIRNINLNHVNICVARGNYTCIEEGKENTNWDTNVISLFYSVLSILGH